MRRADANSKDLTLNGEDLTLNGARARKKKGDKICTLELAEKVMKEHLWIPA